MKTTKGKEMYDIAKGIAKKRNLEFVDWNKLSDKEKLALYEDKTKREKSYVFGDIRIE